MSGTTYGQIWSPSEPDRVMSAEFTFEPPRSVRADLLDAALEEWVKPGQIIPMVHARVVGRGYLTLLDAQWTGISSGLAGTTIKLVAPRCLEGVLLDRVDEREFRRVELTLPVLELLLGPYPAQPENFPKMPTSRAKSVRLTLDDRKHEWDDGTTRVTLEYRWSMSVGATNADVSMVPTVSLSSAKARSVGEWFPTVASLLSILTVATGIVSNPSRLRLFRKRNPNMGDRARQTVEWIGAGVGECEQKLERDKVLLSLDDFDLHPQGLAGMLTEYPALEDEQEVFLGLLTGGIADPDRPLRNRYLDMTAALEAYHAQALEDPKVADRHNQKLERLLEKSQGLNSRDRGLIRHAAKMHGPSLERRLREVADEVGLGDDWAVTPMRMAQVRNQIAHGEPIEKYGSELQLAFEQAFDVARRLVVLRLGVPSWE